MLSVGVGRVEAEKFMQAPGADKVAAGTELEAAEKAQEIEVIQTLPTPYQPTLSEYIDHCVTHCP